MEVPGARTVRLGAAATTRPFVADGYLYVTILPKPTPVKLSRGDRKSISYELCRVELGIYKDSRGVAKPWLACFGKHDKVYCASLQEARQVRADYIERRDINVPKPVGYSCINKMMNKVVKNILKNARRRVRMRNLDDEKREKRNQRNAAWAKRNKKKMRAAVDDWCRRNREHRRECENARNAERRKTDPEFVIKRRVRSRLCGYRNNKGAGKADLTFEQVCCTPKQLEEYLCSQLLEDEDMIAMRVDHVFPMHAYDVCDMEQQKQMMHFSNLQPLSETENSNKSAKLPTKAMAAKVERWAWPPGVTEDMLPDIYDGWATPLRM